MSATEPCLGLKPDGSRCGVVKGLGDSGYCLFHDPDRTEEAAAARLRGATGRPRRHEARYVSVRDVPRLASLEDAPKASAWLWTATLSGKVDKFTAHEAAGALSVFVRAQKESALEAKVKKLAKAIEKLRGAGA